MSSLDPSIRSKPVPPKINKIGIWAFESKHTETFTMKFTAHSFLEILFIREGDGQVETGTLATQCTIGDLVVIPPRQQHRLIDNEASPISLYGLGVDLRWLDAIPNALELFQYGVYSNSDAEQQRIEQHLRRLLYLFQQSDTASQFASIATALTLLSEISYVLNRREDHRHLSLDADSIRDPMMERYIEWLDRNFFETVSIDSGAEVTGMSRRTFTTKFKQRTGVTWLEYVNRLRIDHAVELLKNTDRKITSIAFQCGFEDVSTFYRTFAKFQGKSPGECRG